MDIVFVFISVVFQCDLVKLLQRRIEEKADLKLGLIQPLLEQRLVWMSPLTLDQQQGL